MGIVRLVNSLHQLGATDEARPARSFMDLLGRYQEGYSPAAGVVPPLAELGRTAVLRVPEFRFLTESILEVEAGRASALDALDVGCGALPIARWLARRGHAAVALDRSASTLREVARYEPDRRADGEPVRVAGLAELLPFRDQQFDLVTAAALIHHLPAGNDRLALWEVARVLRPGGFLVLTLEVLPVDTAEHSAWSGPRPAGRALAPLDLERLFAAVDGLFDFPAEPIPLELRELTSHELSGAIAESFLNIGLPRTTRDSATLGALLRRTGRRLTMATGAVAAALFEGQEARRAADGPAHGESNGPLHARPAAPDGRPSRGDAEADLLARLEVSEQERRRLEQVAEARFRIIRRQEQTLEAYRRRYWRERLRRLFGPRIGVLFQYDPIPLQVPTHYASAQPPMPAPTISIVTPSLNQGRFIERTIASVVNQGYPALEFIVQDGGSTDETPRVLERLRDRLAHVAIERDRGFADAINRGFAASTGEIMAYLNSDDVLLPGSLAYVARYLAEHPEVDVVYGHRVIVDELDREIGRWVLPPHDDDIVTWVDYIPQETLFWRRRIWERAGGRVDESFRFAVDWDLILRFRDHGGRFARLPRFIGAFRVHPHQKTSSEMDEVGIREMARLRERCHGRPVSLAEVRQRQAAYLRRHVVYHKLYRLGLLRY